MIIELSNKTNKRVANGEKSCVRFQYLGFILYFKIINIIKIEFEISTFVFQKIQPVF